MSTKRTAPPAWLLGLASAGFVLFTDDYIIAGVLPEIAAEFHVSESVVGQLVTVFALTVAVSAPSSPASPAAGTAGRSSPSH